MSITAKELAEKLGISASAVSIALNGKKGISDEKRDFILRAAKEYGLKRPLRKSFYQSCYLQKARHGLWRHAFLRCRDRRNQCGGRKFRL